MRAHAEYSPDRARETHLVGREVSGVLQNYHTTFENITYEVRGIGRLTSP